MLECIVNVSEGRNEPILARMSAAVRPWLLDVHSDSHHNRSVFSLVGEEAPRALARECVEQLSLERHEGVHPRLGVIDVVPFVPLDGSRFEDAVLARDSFARWIGSELDVPAFLYGPERTLPEVRRTAWTTLAPDTGPHMPHPTAGAVCVGARPPLVAYNVWLDTADLVVARRIATAARSTDLRALGLATGAKVQVSMNLVEPLRCGPADAFDRVRELAGDAGVAVSHAELVGLLPRAVLQRIPSSRWREVDVDDERTVERRLEVLGLSR